MEAVESEAMRAYRELLRNMKAGVFSSQEETDRVLKAVGKSREEATRELQSELSTRDA